LQDVLQPKSLCQTIYLAGRVIFKPRTGKGFRKKWLWPILRTIVTFIGAYLKISKSNY